MHLPRWVHGVELVLGLCVAAAGIAHTLWALPGEWHEMRPSAHHGVAVLGLAMVARAVAEIGVNLQYAGGLQDAAEPTWWTRAHAFLTSHTFEGGVGLLILLAGVAGAVQAATTQLDQAPSWHWGLVLVGFATLVRAAHAFYEAMERLGHVGGPAWLRRTARFLEHPFAQVAMAAALLALAVAEVLDPTHAAALAGAAGAEAAAPAEAATGAPVAHHGLSAFAGSSLARAVPDLVKGGKLVWRTVEEGREAS